MAKPKIKIGAGVKVTGVEAILRNLTRTKQQQAKGMERGLVKAGLMLQRASQKVVPVDTANLKKSAFTRKEKSGFSTVVLVGYTANYAIYVHEDLEASHKPGKIAKYLERPAREHAKEIRAIIAREMEL